MPAKELLIMAQYNHMITLDFKPLQETDLPLLFSWLALPHVATWWRETRDYEKFAAKYREYIAIDDVGPFIIYHHQTPIGYISWADTATDPTRPEQHPAGTYGMDLFIANLDYLGKGYGVTLIKQFLQTILMPKHPFKIIIDPEITNVRAIHVYERVGFKKTAIVQTTDGTTLITAQLMELDPKMSK